jgi:hypothetical protein
VVFRSRLSDLRRYRFAELGRAAICAKHGGVNSYVHPVSTKDPFPANAAPNGLPLELVPDAVLGDVDTLEVTCLWSDELGTSEAWYRLLNLGIPIAPSAGSDTMHNFYRTMAIGATRIYAKPDGAMNLPNYLEAVRRGRSFVTNGPLSNSARAARKRAELSMRRQINKSIGNSKRRRPRRLKKSKFSLTEKSPGAVRA